MRDNKGAIAVFTLLAMLFFLIFAMVIYRNIAAKSRTQVETTEVLLDIYNADTDTAAVYEKMTDDEANYVMYEDFGATSDGDSWQAVYDTHVYANTYGYSVTTNLDEIHIYKSNKSTVIPIETNTNWNGATIYIHDEELDEDYDGDLDGDGSDEVRLNHIFEISSGVNSITITDTDLLDSIEINTSTTSIDELTNYLSKKGYSYSQYTCIVYNENEKQFKRYSSSSSQSSGTVMQDIFVIDSDGTLENEIQWDFDEGEITKIVLYPILSESITVKNGDFVTIVPSPTSDNPNGYWCDEVSYLRRGIECSRGNTVISGLTHEVEYYSGNNLVSASDLLEGPYYGFISIQNASFVTLKNTSLYTHLSEDGGSSASTYDLIVDYSTNVTIKNVDSNDIDNSERWGITGSNYCKDITYTDCTLNRIDTHRGVHNLTIEDCTIGVRGITQTGSGTMKITGTNVTGSSYFVDLRADYGSTWDGTIYIEDCEFESDSIQALIHYSVSYDSDGSLHDFGYEQYLPNVVIDGLNITNTASDLTVKNTSSINIPIFYGNSQKYVNGTKKYPILTEGDGMGNYNLLDSVYVGDYTITEDGKTDTGQLLYLGLFYNKSNASSFPEWECTFSTSTSNGNTILWINLDDTTRGESRCGRIQIDVY